MGGLKKKLGDVDMDLKNNKELAHIEAIIKAMTTAERSNTNIINGSRRKRIAAGSGTRVQDINKLLKQFAEMKKMMKKMTGAKGKKGLKGFPKGMQNMKFPF